MQLDMEREKQKVEEKGVYTDKKQRRGKNKKKN